MAILRAALLVTLVASVGACGAQSRQPTTPGAAYLGQFGAGELGIYLSARAPSQNTSGSPTNAGRLYALRASDGAPVWSAATDGVVFELAAADGMLYVSIVTQDASSVPHGGVVALRLRDGAQVWRQTGDRPQLLVAAGDGALYVLTALGLERERVQALRASDGHPLWAVTLQGTPTAGHGNGTAFAGGALYLPVVASPSAGPVQLRLIALRDSDGTQLWSTGPSGVITGPVAANGVIYAQSAEGGDAPGSSAQTSVLAWRASDGKPLWKHTILPSGQSGAATALVPSGDALYLGLSFGATLAGTPPDQLLALDAATGAERWRRDAGGSVQTLAADAHTADAHTADAHTADAHTADAHTAGALYAATMAYSSSTFGAPPATSIRAYGAADGKQVWVRPVPDGGLSGALGAANGVVYLPIAAQGGSATGTMDAVETLNASDGSPRWSSPIDGSVSQWLAAPA